MKIKAHIDEDIKRAMLAGEKTLVTTLRGLKSAILYEEVAKGARDQGLGEDAVIDLLSKEAKKRQESADMYAQGGSIERSEAEAREKKIIEKYLPTQLTHEELDKIVTEVIFEEKATGMSDMGKVIASVKVRSRGSADGAAISKIVKEKLSS